MNPYHRAVRAALAGMERERAVRWLAALRGLTKLVIPNSSVCPGWGAVKVTPETAAAATA